MDKWIGSWYVTGIFFKKFHITRFLTTTQYDPLSHNPLGTLANFVFICTFQFVVRLHSVIDVVHELQRLNQQTLEALSESDSYFVGKTMNTSEGDVEREKKIFQKRETKINCSLLNRWIGEDEAFFLSLKWYGIGSTSTNLIRFLSLHAKSNNIKKTSLQWLHSYSVGARPHNPPTQKK